MERNYYARLSYENGRFFIKGYVIKCFTYEEIKKRWKHGELWKLVK